MTSPLVKGVNFIQTTKKLVQKAINNITKQTNYLKEEIKANQIEERLQTKIMQEK